MSIVSLESADEKKVSASILNFLTAYGIISLLSKCGGAKLKGIPVKALFTYTLTNVFRMGLKLLLKIYTKLQKVRHMSNFALSNVLVK